MKDKEEISYKKFLDFFKKSEEGKKEIEEKKEEIKEEIKEETPEKKIKGKKIKERKEVEEKEEPLEIEVKPQEIKEKLPEAIIEIEELKEDEEFLIFKVGKESYAIYTHDAAEVITGLEIVESSDLPSYAIGMANFRERIIPVLSFSKLLNIEEERSPYSFIFIEKEKRESFFIRVGEVRGIYKKRDLKLLEVPYDLDKEIFKKIILINKELVPLIDVLKLIEKKE